MARWLSRLVGRAISPEPTAFELLEQRVEGLRDELISLTPLITQVRELRSGMAQFDFLTDELKQVRGEIRRLGAALDRLQAQAEADRSAERNWTAIVRRLALLETHVDGLLHWGPNPEKRRPRAA
jgi:hypothetical protein